jgi:hypothetical protein
MLGLLKIQQLLGNVNIAVLQSPTDLEKNVGATQDTTAAGNVDIAASNPQLT